MNIEYRTDYMSTKDPVQINFHFWLLLRPQCVRIWSSTLEKNYGEDTLFGETDSLLSVLLSYRKPRRISRLQQKVIFIVLPKI